MNSFLGNKRNAPSREHLPYYCSLCGDEVLTTDIAIDELPRRRADESFICVEGKVAIENKMVGGKVMIIRRGSNKYEKQYPYICKSCNIIVAYQSTDFEEGKKENDDKNKQESALLGKRQRKIIYILSDSLVTSPKQSSLSIEIEKIKENQSKKSTNNYIRIKKK